MAENINNERREGPNYLVPQEFLQSTEANISEMINTILEEQKLDCEEALEPYGEQLGEISAIEKLIAKTEETEAEQKAEITHVKEQAEKQKQYIKEQAEKQQQYIKEQAEKQKQYIKEQAEKQEQQVDEQAAKVTSQIQKELQSTKSKMEKFQKIKSDLESKQLTSADSHFELQ